MIDKKRYIFLDVSRFLAFYLVFFYHFLIRIAENGIVGMDAVRKIYEHPNFHIATLGVSLFFVISGAGLMMSADYKWNVKDYYRKRAVRILIPFYIAYVGIFAAMFWMKKGQVFEAGIPKRNILFTIAGIDGYIQEMGIPTFSLGVGEWFLGCLIIMYLIFPVLRMLMIKYQRIFMAAAAILYLAGVLSRTAELPVHMSFIVKLYEFILGMYLGTCLEKIKKWSLKITVPVMLAFFVLPFSIPLQEGFKITIFSMAVVLVVSQMENIFNGRDKLKIILNQFGKFSFEMYLIHHWVIIVMTQYMGEFVSGMAGLIVLFWAELFVTLVGAVIVKRIAQGIQFCYNNVLKI